MSKFVVVALNTDFRDDKTWTAGVIGPFFTSEDAKSFAESDLEKYVAINPNEFVTTDWSVEELDDPLDKLNWN